MSSPEPNSAARPTEVDPIVSLFKQYLAARAHPRALPRRIKAAIPRARPETILAMLEAAAQTVATPQPHDRRLRAMIQELQASNEMLSSQLHKLSQPPHCIARLLRFDPDSSRAIVAAGPNARTEVAVDGNVPVAQLIAGRDVILSAERNCILRIVPEGAAAAGQLGGGRIARFAAFVDDAPHSTDAMRLAAVTDAHGESLVTLPQHLAAEVEAALADGQPTPRLVVDELGWVLSLCSSPADDPRAAESRFRLDLDPIDPHEVIGLETQRQKIDRVLRKLPERSGFILCEGATGSGKTHLARYACGQLRARGDTIVLGLQSSHDHRYVGQEESDVAALFACARASVMAGKQVMLFLDEVDKFFYRSRHGQSVHVNSARATWLQELSTTPESQGILVYATTNKAADLPDELHNRVTQPLSFEGIDRELAGSMLDHFLASDSLVAEQRQVTIDAITAWTHDRLPQATIATVTRRDQSEVHLHGCDLRQVSARFFQEVASRIADAALVDGPLDSQAATAIVSAHLDDVVAGIGLSADNVADRTFVALPPRNGAEHVQVHNRSAAIAAPQFHYELSGGDDGQTS